MAPPIAGMWVIFWGVTKDMLPSLHAFSQCVLPWITLPCNMTNLSVEYGDFYLFTLEFFSNEWMAIAKLKRLRGFQLHSHLRHSSSGSPFPVCLIWLHRAKRGGNQVTTKGFQQSWAPCRIDLHVCIALACHGWSCQGTQWNLSRFSILSAHGYSNDFTENFGEPIMS